MSENVSARAWKRVFNRPPSADLSLVVFSGLIVWGIGAVVCHFAGVTTGFAFGLALLWTAWGFFDTFKQRRMEYFGHLADEIVDELKDQFAQISRQLVELQAGVSRLEGHSGVEATEDHLDQIAAQLVEMKRDINKVEVSERLGKLQESASELEELSGMVDAKPQEPHPPWHTTHDPGGIYAPWIATDDDVERAIQLAINETNATSEMQMGIAIKAARGRLRGKQFDEQGLRKLVRTRLEKKL